MADDSYQQIFQRIREELLQECPELENLLRQADSASPLETLKRVLDLLGKDRELAEKAEQIFLSSVDLGQTNLVKLPDREQMLERWGFTDEDLVFQPFEDRPQFSLHPIFMGRILELLQFDGDVPELRTGPLPEGGSPAVPVRTEARDPVMLGALLRDASREVTGELQAAQEIRGEKLTTAVAVLGASHAVVRAHLDTPVGVPGYIPGQRPALRKMASPSSVEVAALPFREQQDLAHKALTSTQGRRSASPIIADLLLQAIQEAGYDSVEIGEGKTPVIEAQWRTDISGSSRERNPRFSFVDVAARSLGRQLKVELERRAKDTPLLLSVTPINEISEREVGFRAVLSQ